MSGCGQASLTALRWGKPERIPNDRVLQTFGSYGAKAGSRRRASGEFSVPRKGATAMFDPFGVGVNSGSYPRVAACRPYPRLYSLSPSGTSEEGAGTFFVCFVFFVGDLGWHGTQSLSLSLPVLTGGAPFLPVGFPTLTEPLLTCGLLTHHARMKAPFRRLLIFRAMNAARILASSVTSPAKNSSSVA